MDDAESLDKSPGDDAFAFARTTEARFFRELVQATDAKVEGHVSTAAFTQGMKGARWATFLLLLAASTPAMAQPQSNEAAPGQGISTLVEVAKNLYGEGREAYQAGKFALAIDTWSRCAALLGSHERHAAQLDALVYDIARARFGLFRRSRDVGQLKQALSELEGRRMITAGPKRPKLRARLRALSEELERRLKDEGVAALPKEMPSTEIETTSSSSPPPPRFQPKQTPVSKRSNGEASQGPGATVNRRAGLGWRRATATTGILAGSGLVAVAVGLALGQHAQRSAPGRGLSIAELNRIANRGAFGNGLATVSASVSAGLVISTVVTGVISARLARRARSG